MLAFGVDDPRRRQPLNWQRQRDTATARPFFPATVPAATPKRKRTGRGFLTGLQGKRTAPARPSRKNPQMTTTPSAVRNIPLDKLVPSPTNVRKTPPSAAEDAELKASIRARGLKQNLVAHPAAGEKKGVLAVTAGGRRLKALQELAAEGVIPADFKVPCLVEEPEAAIETSLMENRIRAALLTGGRVRRHGGPDRQRANLSRRSPPGLASRNATSGSACGSASSRPNCSTLIAPATSTSMS